MTNEFWSDPSKTITENGLVLAKNMNLQVSAANTILSPGKFEGEHVSTLYFWQLFLDGFCDHDDGETLSWDITPSEAKHLGNADATRFVITCTDDGFVIGDLV